MQVRFKSTQKEHLKLAKHLSKTLYKLGLKRVRFYDFIAFCPLIMGIVSLSVVLSNLEEVVAFHYEHLYYIWLSYILVGYVVFIELYATYFRPIIFHKIQLKTYSWIEQTSILSIQERGLLHQTDTSETLYFYSSITGVQNIYQHLLIVIDKYRYIGIPYSCFDDEEHRLKFEKILQNQRKKV